MHIFPKNHKELVGALRKSLMSTLEADGIKSVEPMGGLPTALAIIGGPEVQFDIGRDVSVVSIAAIEREHLDTWVDTVTAIDNMLRVRCSWSLIQEPNATQWTSKSSPITGASAAAEKLKAGDGDVDVTMRIQVPTQKLLQALEIEYETKRSL